jgi:hypothetical protein
MKEIDETKYTPITKERLVDEIAGSIQSLTDSLETTEELDYAWRKIQKALGYLSAKDSMYKYRKEIK